MFSFGFDFMSAQRHGVTGPSAIDFDFLSGPLPAGVQFSRSSDAILYALNGDLTQVGVNVARFTNDPETGQGLLIEPSSVNILPHAIATRNSWSRSGATVTDVSLNALGLFPGVSVISEGQNWHRILDHATLNMGQAYSVTIYYRAGTSGMAAVTLKDGGSGASSSVGGTAGALTLDSNAAGAVTDLAEVLLPDAQTYRMRFTYVPNFTGAFNIGFGPNSRTAGEDVILLGMQMEPAVSPSSFILSDGGSTVRAADQIGLTGLTGLYDVSVTYGDDSTEVFSAQTVDQGYWPPLSKTTLKSMRLTPL
ncbi:phage head spike fiber domain-containing protein [Pseudaestuariivita rosea]|uniref:phage head spike fiber domain-containing protein n=1 Tax=Pseudaestuariivita rosea TaxID=2763263 RepID=UPI001ABAB8B0|nr:hypothetical protein [Pseudaestuariivita rosea]